MQEFLSERLKMIGYRDKITFLFLIVILYLLIFFYYPLITILKYAFITADKAFSYEHFIRILSKVRVIQAIQFTFIQAILSTLVSIALGLPIAYILTKYEFFGKRFLEAFLLVPFVLPGVVVGFAFSILIGVEGIFSNFLNNLLNLNWGIKEWGFISIIFAHAFYNSPLIALMTAGLWKRLDPDIEHAAETLGSYGLKKFFKVVLPVIAPGLISSSILTFIFCFTSFEVILLLGGFRYRTIEVEIYSLYRTRLDFEGAAALSIIQILMITIFLFLYFRSLEKYAEVRRIGATSTYPTIKLFREKKSLKMVLIIAYLFAYILFIGLPIGMIIIYSFIDPVTDTITLDGYKGLFSTTRNPYLGAPPVVAPINTILFSIFTTIISLTLGLISAYSIKTRSTLSILTNIMIFVPLATSRITIGLGIILGFGSIGWLYQDTRPLILASHIIIAYPFVTRAALNGLTRLDPDILHSSEIMGVYGIKRFLKIDLPIIAPSLTVGAALAFATSLGEFAATNILYRGNYPTLTVLLFLMIAGRRFVVASAAAAMLIYLSLLSFIMIIKSGEDLSSGF